MWIQPTPLLWALRDNLKLVGTESIDAGGGNALVGQMAFKDGVPEKSNFHPYRMIRMSEALKRIEVYFVENEIDPTSLGEPLFPPVFAALANALHEATEKRLHRPARGLAIQL